MLNINNTKVVDNFIKNDTLFIKLSNGTVLKSNNYSIIYDFNIESFELLSNRKITNKILDIEVENILLNTSMINSELYLNLEINDLIGMTINFDIVNDCIYINLVVPADYLIKNSVKFSDCVDEGEVTEHYENIITIHEIDLTKDNPEIVYNILKYIL